jgi:hypothetical protein
MPKLNIALLGSPQSPYPHLRITLELDVYGSFERRDAQKLAEQIQGAITPLIEQGQGKHTKSELKM